jgi:hypothetical protein
MPLKPTAGTWVSDGGSPEARTTPMASSLIVDAFT